MAASWSSASGDFIEARLPLLPGDTSCVGPADRVLDGLCPVPRRRAVARGEPVISAGGVEPARGVRDFRSARYLAHATPGNRNRQRLADYKHTQRVRSTPARTIQ